jgi:hypothetical protein
MYFLSSVLNIYIFVRRMKKLESMHDLNTIGRAELLYMTMDHDEMIGGADLEMGAILASGETLDGENLPPQQLNEYTVVTQQPSTNQITLGKDQHSATTITTLRRQHNVLDVPWQPPDIKKATRYADYVQPRKGGKGGKLFNFWKTTTGRHCCLGSFGEQFDLMEEGQISEFGIYGPGVTNYFKFMKFTFWMFILLTIIALPMIVLNSQPGDPTNLGLKALASTTIGNLALAKSNNTLSVHIPGCNSFALLGDGTCSFNGQDLAVFYAILDIIICAVIFVGYIWLIVFEKNEEVELNRSTSKFSKTMHIDIAFF